RIAHKFHLVELVDAEQSTGVFPRRPGLTPEAGGICSEPRRQIRFGEDFVTVKVGYGYFRGWNEKEIFALERVHVVLKFWKLGGARHAGTVDDHRHPRFLIAVIASVGVEHQVHERPHESRAESAKDDESGPADLGATLEINEAEPGADLPMRRDARTLARCPPRPDDRIALFPAGWNLIERDVRQLEKDRR